MVILLLILTGLKIEIVIVIIMNQTSIFSDIDTILKDAVNAKLERKLDKLASLILNSVDNEHHSSIKTILEKQRYSIRTTLKLNAVRKSRTKKEVESDIRCMARIGLGTQCSRSKSSNNTDYCKSHLISLPYGRIDQPEPSGQVISKRRGRRSKNEKEYNISNLDMNKYVQSILINIDSQPYLLDQNNILYQFNNKNEIVGTVVNDVVEWY